MEKQFEAFDCLWGDCTPPDGTGGIKTPVIDPWQSPPFNPGVSVPQTTVKQLAPWPARNQPNITNNYYGIPPTQTATAAQAAAGARKLPAKANDGMIFGFSPLVVLGAAAVGLYFLSQMDGKK